VTETNENDLPELGGTPAFGGGRGCCGQRHARGGAGRGALLEPAILAALLRGGGHGYDLRNTITELTGGDLCVDHGGLYRALRRLEDEDFVRSMWVEGGSGPRRRDYELTERGCELAADWVVHLRERQRLAAMMADELERHVKDRIDTEDEA